MHQGTVLWYGPEIGYGFIHKDGEIENIYVDRVGLAGSGLETLEMSQRVLYDVIQGREGEEAKNISKV